MPTLNELRGPEIEALYLAGRSTTAIATQLETTPPSVRAVLIKRGVPLRAQGCVKGTRKPAQDIFSPAQVAEVEQLLMRGLPVAHVAEKLGVAPITITRYAKRLNLHVPRKSLAARGPEILAALASGVPAADVAKQHDTSKHSIWSFSRRAGVDLKSADDARRAAAAMPAEVREKRRYTRERLRASVDPGFAAQMQNRVQRVNENRRGRYAPAMAAFRAQGCQVCGIRNPLVLDVHHRDPSTKLFGVNKREPLRVTVAELEAEIAKCDCLCAYHHRILHAASAPPRREDDLSKTGLQVVEARKRLEPILDAFFARGCRCGNQGPVGLSAHHRDPSTKEFNVAQAVFLRVPDDVLVAELEKCDCLCENCHRIAHHGNTLEGPEV